jgi:hypothetical protein
MENVLCVGYNQDGSPCHRHHAIGRSTCRWHHPEVLDQRAAAHEAEAARLRSMLA